MRSIAIINQKGGCGKTTTAINLAAAFARRGHRTLLVDMDPQSHCAAGLAVPEERIEAGIGEALIAEHHDFELRRLLWEVVRGLYLLPSTTRLAALEAPGGGLHELPDRDRRLESLLTRLAPQFDMCLIDCPPTIGLLTFNALRAAREALIPVETGFFSLRGAQKQWKTIQRLIDRLGQPVVCHLLPTLHDERSSNARNVLAALKREFGSQLLTTIIREDDTLREAASYGQPVGEYAPGSGADRDFEALADWLEDRADMAPTIEVFASVGASLIGRIDSGPFSLNERSGEPEVEQTGLSSSRAAELARRVRQMTVTEPLELQGTSVEGQHTFGVTATEHGVRFAQPGDTSQTIHVAGDFNNWSARATPLRYNFEAGVYEAEVVLPPGRYEYLLIIDGAWVVDPFNEVDAPFGHGRCSTFTVHPPRKIEYIEQPPQLLRDEWSIAERDSS